jgi:hypothetical protein
MLAGKQMLFCFQFDCEAGTVNSNIIAFFASGASIRAEVGKYERK